VVNGPCRCPDSRYLSRGLREIVDNMVSEASDILTRNAALVNKMAKL